MKRSAGFAWSARTLYLAIGFAGLALAVTSIADMFAPRPYDGIVPVPYSRKGIAVRAVVSGGPADRAGIRAGDCVLGIGKRMVDSSSDASAELRKHAIGETVPYIYRRGPCTAEATSDLPIVPVRLSSERLGGTTYLYAAALGFLFFFIGFFVFNRRPEDRAARIFFLLCVLFLLFFVCRLRPASYWWVDLFVQNTGTISLFLLPAAFLHFFLVFPRPTRFHFADEESPSSVAGAIQKFLNGSRLLYFLISAVP